MTYENGTKGELFNCPGRWKVSCGPALKAGAGVGKDLSATVQAATISSMRNDLLKVSVRAPGFSRFEDGYLHCCEFKRK